MAITKRIQVRKLGKAALKIVTIMFGMPMAFNVLAKFDNRLNFSPYLERIIIGFEKFSEAIWGKISNYLQVDLQEIHSILTFTLLFFSVTVSGLAIRYMSSKELTEIPAPDGTWPNYRLRMRLILIESTLALLTFYFLSWYLSEAGLSAYALPMVFAGYVCARLTEIKRFNFHPNQSKAQKIFLYLGFSIIVIYGVWAAVDLFGYSIQENSRDNEYSLPLISYLLLAFIVSLLSFISSKYCKKNIIYLGLWVLGIVILNWLETTGRPGIEKFLTNSGI